MNKERVFDCTGDNIPWVYRREFIADDKIWLDCVAPEIELNVEDIMIIRIPFSDRSITGKIEHIISREDAPGIWQNSYFKNNSYYKLILKIQNYDTTK